MGELAVEVGNEIPAQVGTFEWSRVHRIMQGDKVVITHDGHDEGLVPNEDEGLVVGFANDEQTYVNVDFGEKGVHVLTEDELRRTGA